MLRFFSRFQADSRLKSGRFGPFRVGGNAPFSPAIVGDDVDNAGIRTPEFQIFNYLSKLLQNHEHPYWTNLSHRYNIELIKDSIIDTFPMVAGQEPLRIVRKEWFEANVVHFEQTNLMTYFAKDNTEVVTLFINDFKTAIETLINK